ncbi:cytochrome P450 [Aspergillus foveolatus]|uniref:cytochrome P450 n=1 Tax=Aspergillus foveolatus TaxID=210207 RepID=UPI003CCD0DD4
MYLFYGTEIIQKKFTKSNNEIFEVFAPDGRYVFISSHKHLRELDAAPDTVLSLQAASKQMLQPRYTMHGFNWFDRRGTEGVGFVRALRTLLTNNIPQLLPKLSILIKSSLTVFVPGSRHSPVYYVVQKLVVVTNAVSFFGEDLARNEAFMDSALRYIEETIICAEILRLMPRALTPVLGALIQRCLRSHAAIYEALLPIAEQRCLERDFAKLGHEVPKHADCIQWIMETSPRKAPWSGKRIVHELMAIWFGSVHALTTTITFAIHDLCLHPEHTQPLRAELEAEYSQFLQTGRGLPLLDSFIKESARLTPVESMSTRRQALAPFEFSDGTKLAVGDWACTPVRAIMQSEALYPSPLEFHGFRFVDPAASPKPSSLCDADASWHVWGSGRMVCPGRYYAAAVMKLVLAQIILEYDCRLVHQAARRLFTWRSTMLPNPRTKVIFSPRSNPVSAG